MGEPDNHYYTQSTDGKGHSALLHVKFPPQLAARLSEFIATKAIPQYRTREDIIRDATIKLLMDLDIDSYTPLKMELLAAEARRSLNELTYINQNFSEIKRAVREDMLDESEVMLAADEMLQATSNPVIKEKIKQFLDEI